MRCRFCLYVLLCATALLSFPVVSAEEAPCTAHDGDNYYDLSSLKSRYVKSSIEDIRTLPGPAMSTLHMTV